MKLSAGALKLLKTIAEYDVGDGVVFDNAPYGRWALAASPNYVVNGSTFRTLDRHDLIDVGDGRSDPVKITKRGLGYLEGLL